MHNSPSPRRAPPSASHGNHHSLSDPPPYQNRPLSTSDQQRQRGQPPVQQPSSLRSPTASSPPWRAQLSGASPADLDSPRLPPRPRSATADSPRARRVQIQQRMATSRSGQQQIQICASSGELVVLPIHAIPSPETSTVAFPSNLATPPCSPLARNRTTATMAATRPATRTTDPDSDQQHKQRASGDFRPFRRARDLQIAARSSPGPWLPSYAVRQRRAAPRRP